jgi:DNA-binding LacI/PurR family transcriptional regulator
MRTAGTVIFLDIDGVLVTAQHLMRIPREQIERELPGVRWSFQPFAPEAVEALNWLTDQTGATIVISSTWRLGRSLPELRQILKHQGVTGLIIDCTPRLLEPNGWKQQERGHEIQHWLDHTHHDIHNFVIIDDDEDMAHLLPHLMKTSNDVGFTMDQARKVLERLQHEKVVTHFSPQVAAK